MQISKDLRRTVIFIGTLGSNDTFVPYGTGFLAQAEACSYLITNKHIAEPLDDAPFLIRLNKASGGADIVSIDPVELAEKWHFHPTDPDVDIAVMPLNRDLERAGYDTRVVGEAIFVNDSHIVGELIGVGDACYTVGLFRLMAGVGRNLPIVHTGNIALMPDEERIPTKDWLNSSKRRYVEGYLVETTNLPGLSGSPVFVRLSFVHNINHDGILAPARMALATVFLLGVWQSSWDAPLEGVSLVPKAGAEPEFPLELDRLHQFKDSAIFSIRLN
jgi:hypothetical protein